MSTTNTIAQRTSPAGARLGQDDCTRDMRSVLLMLWRRKVLISGVFLIGLSLALLLVTFMQPHYTARSLLLIDAGQKASLHQDIVSLFPDMAQLDTALILSEVEIMRSRMMARKVVERLNLMADAEFNPRFKSMEAPNIEQSSNRLFKSLSLYQRETTKLPSEVLESELEAVVTHFLKNLNVRAVFGANVVQVEYSSRDAAKAATIANSIVDIYIDQRLEDKFRASRKVTFWLDKRVNDLRRQVREAEEAVVLYKKEHGIVQGARAAISAEQMSILNARLMEARAEEAEMRAKLEHVQGLSGDQVGLDALLEIVDTPLVQALKLQDLELSQELSQLQKRYGRKHPKIIGINAKLKKVQQALADEAGRVSQRIESDLSAVNARAQALENAIMRLAGQRQDNDVAMIALRALEREAAVSQLILGQFLEVYKKSNAREELQEADERVVSYAVAPQHPSFPNRSRLISLAGGVSLLLGLLLAILSERLENTFRSARQLEARLGYPCYALIPQLLGQKTKVAMSNYVVERPSSTLSEAVRTLRMVLNLRMPEGIENPKVIAVTSSFSGEGKTTLSMWLARLAAKSGERVIIVDGDLRRPNIHRVLGQDNPMSLVEYLTGQADLDEVIQTDEATGLHMIYGRSVPNSALDLICSQKMADLVAALRKDYDLVIIDSPACLAVSDARMIARYADYTLYNVAWNKTPQDAVQNGVKQFYDMHYDRLATVLTSVDVTRHARYGFGDTVYYYGQYKEYCAE